MKYCVKYQVIIKNKIIKDIFGEVDYLKSKFNYYEISIYISLNIKFIG